MMKCISEFPTKSIPLYPITKQDTMHLNEVPEDGSSLPLMEAFYTLQGEGYHTGKAAFFIRLGGCDVGCHWCDVKESWDANIHPLTPSDQIVEQALQHPAKSVVITGGEPLLYNLEYLTQALHQAGIRIFLETSGAYPLTGHWDWICLSPKKFKKPRPDVCARADELKVIVFNKSDFSWAETYADTVGPNCKLFLQPEWSKSAEVTPLIVDYIKENPRWEVSLQTHKYLHIP